MHVTMYDDIADVPPSEWDAVVTAAHAPVFYRHAYLVAHARSGVSRPLASRFVVVRDDRGVPAAVCPATLQQPADPLGVLRAGVPGFEADDRCLLTHFWQCYDTVIPALTPVAARHVGAALAELAGELGARWYGAVDVGRDAVGEVAAALRMAPGDAVETDERFRLEISALHDFRDYLAILTRNPARNLRRYLRRASDRHVEVRCVAPTAATLDEAITLVRATAERHGNTGMYPDGPFQDFVRQLGELVVAVEIRDEGRLVGVGLCLVDERRFHLWTAGAAVVDDAPYSPYGLVFAEAIRAAIASGRPVLEGGRRNREYKERHGLRRVPLFALVRAVDSGPAPHPQPTEARP